MEPEDLDIPAITEARRKAIGRSIHPAGLDELKALGEGLFPYHDNPWREIYFDFLKENSATTIHRATTHDGVGIIYCHAKDKGLWFVPGKGMGPLQEEGRGIMKEAVERPQR